MVDALKAAAVAAKGAVWECHLDGDPNIWLRFVSREGGLPDYGSDRADVVSSTAIYNIIRTNDAGELREKLKDLALSPDILLKYL